MVSNNTYLWALSEPYSDLEKYQRAVREGFLDEDNKVEAVVYDCCHIFDVLEGHAVSAASGVNLGIVKTSRNASQKMVWVSTKDGMGFQVGYSYLWPEQFDHMQSRLIKEFLDWGGHYYSESGAGDDLGLARPTKHLAPSTLY